VQPSNPALKRVATLNLSLIPICRRSRPQRKPGLPLWRDADAIAPLFDAYRQFYEQPTNLPLATRFISDRLQNNESVILLAVSEDQQFMGFCQLYPSFCSVEAMPIYSLYDLFVQPEARRYRAGKALLQGAERHAARNVFCTIGLTTVKTNASALSLHESLGWVRDDIFYEYSKHIKD
jgi:ribosomal protein S18 acetylase RimI-like enzyme